MRNARSLSGAAASLRRLAYAAALVAAAAAPPAWAAQVVTPRHVSGASGVSAGTDLAGTTVTVPAGTTLTFDVQYSVTAPQTANEAGLGLKVRYDASRFDNVVVTPVNAAAGNFTNVTNLLTRCVIGGPSEQAGTYASPAFATPREVVFGWLDTAVRANGAPGWPGTADPAAPNGCLSPGFATSTAAVALPATLFRIALRTRTTFTSGSTSVVLTADGNVSQAGGTGSLADRSFTVVPAAAPPPPALTLATTNPYVSRKTHGTAGTFDLPVAASGSLTAGTTVTVEPRQSQSGSHLVVISFSGPVSSAHFPAGSVTATVGPSTPLPVSTAFSGNSLLVTVGSGATPVPNGSRVRVQATGAGAAAGLNPSVVLGFLVGDVNASRSVNNSDINTVKRLAGTAANASNFRNDVTADGAINATDETAVRNASPTTLP